MSHPLPDMLQATLNKMREMVDTNSVVGDPIVTPDGVTILPVSRISYGYGGGGSDFQSKGSGANPFGGGTGIGVKITPVAFLIIHGESVRMLPVSAPANSTADRLVEMIPDTLDKISSFIDSRKSVKEDSAGE